MADGRRPLATTTSSPRDNRKRLNRFETRHNNILDRQPLRRRVRFGHDQLGRDLRRYGRGAVADQDVRRPAGGCPRPGRGPRDAPFVPLSGGGRRIGVRRVAVSVAQGGAVMGRRLLRPRPGHAGPRPADQLGQVVALSHGRGPHGGVAAVARGGRRRSALADRGQCPLSGPRPRRLEPPLSASSAGRTGLRADPSRPRSTRWPAS